MGAPATSRKQGLRVGPRAAAWLALGAVALLRWPLLLRRLQDLDEPNFASIAALARTGRSTATAASTTSRPASSGSISSRSPSAAATRCRAVHLLCVAAVLATAFILGRVARRIAGERAGFYTALLYGVFSMAYDPRMMAANTENFMMLPLAASMWLLVRATRPDRRAAPAPARSSRSPACSSRSRW